MATTDNKILTGAGVAKLSQLVKDAIAQGGGGTEYTAGLGVGIGDKNNLTSIGAFIPWLMTGNNLAIQNLLKDSATQVATREEFITALKQGKIVYISSYAVGTFSDLSQWQEIFPDITSRYDVKVYTIDGTARTATENISPSVSTAFNDQYAIEEGTHSFFRFTNGMLFPTISDAYIGTHTGITSTKLGGAIDELAAKETPIATTETAGTVIPDGTTITIDSNGVISSQGGGSSLPSDPVVDGSYKLVNTVATVEGTQTATQSWQEDAGYTAGSGINIDSNNVITNNGAVGLVASLDALYGIGVGANGYNSPGTYSRSDKIDDLIEYLLLGWPEAILSSSSNRTITAEQIQKLGVSREISIDNSGNKSEVSISTAYTFGSKWIYWKANECLFRVPYEGYGVRTYALANRIGYDNTTSGLAATTIKGAIDELATTRIADALVSEETTPSVANTINWQYE